MMPWLALAVMVIPTFCFFEAVGVSKRDREITTLSRQLRRLVHANRFTEEFALPLWLLFCVWFTIHIFFT